MSKHRTPRHVASRVSIRSRRPEAAMLPRLWPDLPRENKRQLARALAALLWRMRPPGGRARANRHVEHNK